MLVRSMPALAWPWPRKACTICLHAGTTMLLDAHLCLRMHGCSAEDRASQGMRT
jgi:hypothetical protein